jgi:acetyl-CoA carboxylase biotin carboxyl carrier protein
MSLRYEDIADILKIIEASSCDELIIETGEVKLVIRRRGPGQAPPASAPARAVENASLRQNESLPAAASAPAEASAPAVRPVDLQPTGNQVVVRAPMVGTFYRAPSPDAAPFVEVGSEVRAGDPLCLIEVMKLFTTIHAEQSGRIARIGAGDGELVEYGRILFVIDASA